MMTAKICQNATAICVLLILSAGASLTMAHHSISIFDRGTEVSLRGSVVEWYTGRPHAYLKLEVTEENGDSVIYQLDFGNTPRMLEDNGWDKNTFRPGDPVRVTGSPSRLKNDPRLLVATLFQPDGEMVARRQAGNPEGGEENISEGDTPLFTAGLPIDQITLPKIQFDGEITAADWSDESVTMSIRGSEEGATEQDYHLKYVGAELLFEAQGARAEDYPIGTAVRVIGFIDRDQGNIVFPENLYAGEKTIGNRIRAARAALQHLGVISPDTE